MIPRLDVKEIRVIEKSYEHWEEDKIVTLCSRLSAMHAMQKTQLSWKIDVQWIVQISSKNEFKIFL